MPNRQLTAKPHKYQAICLEIGALIDRIEPGGKLPSEREMAKHFSCTTITVRRSLSLLEKEGRIERRHGSGTYVADKPDSDKIQPPMVNRVGILAYAGSDAYGLKVLQALTEEAITLSIDLRLRWVTGFGESALAQAKSLASEGCCAVTLPWFPEDVASNVSRFVAAAGVPVSIPTLLPGLERECFEKPALFGKSIVNLIEGISCYVRSLGRKSIAFLGPDTPSDMILQKKISAYASYVCRHNLEQICGLVEPAPSAMDTLAERWAHLCGSLAVVSYDDNHAQRFMTAMHKRGLSAPDDYVIIGANNIDESALYDPPLTTVYHSYNYIAEWLLRNAVAMARGETDQSSEGAGHTLLIRESCGGQKAGPAIVKELASLGINIEYGKGLALPASYTQSV